ncbi:MAG: hypothetical protein ACE5H8_11855 [Alphaproteobacteria bacterium]
MFSRIDSGRAQRMGLILVFMMALQSPPVGAALITGYASAKLGFLIERWWAV